MTQGQWLAWVCQSRLGSFITPAYIIILVPDTTANTIQMRMREESAQAAGTALPGVSTMEFAADLTVERAGRWEQGDF